jgi:hypothetical protein
MSGWIWRLSRRSPAVAAAFLFVAFAAGWSLSPTPVRETDEPSAETSRAGVERSTEIVQRWLQPVLPARAADGSAAMVSPPAAQHVMRDNPLPLTVVVEAAEGAAAEGGFADERRAARTQYATPRLVPGDRPMVTLSFYYCEESAGARGDGGGFCGRMRDGSVVRPGAAACDVAYLGQRFRIHGDPSGRAYFCADTGSAVHGMHRDIWFLDNRAGWEWQNRVGRTAVIEILP